MAKKSPMVTFIYNYQKNSMTCIKTSRWCGGLEHSLELGGLVFDSGHRRWSSGTMVGPTVVQAALVVGSGSLK